MIIRWLAIWWITGCIGVALDLYWHWPTFVAYVRRTQWTMLGALVFILGMTMLGPINVAGVLAMKFKSKGAR